MKKEEEKKKKQKKKKRHSSLEERCKNNPSEMKPKPSERLYKRVRNVCLQSAMRSRFPIQFPVFGLLIESVEEPTALRVFSLINNLNVSYTS